MTAAALSKSFSIPTISSLPPSVFAAFSRSATVFSNPRNSPSISARWLVIASAIAALSACVACSAVVKDALWLVRKGARCAASRDVGARRCGLRKDVSQWSCRGLGVCIRYWHCRSRCAALLTTLHACSTLPSTSCIRNQVVQLVQTRDHIALIHKCLEFALKHVRNILASSCTHSPSIQH